MSVLIDSVEYPSHAEFFERYPWKRMEFKRINTPKYLKAVDVPCADCGLRWHPAVMTLDHTDRSTGYRNAKGKRRVPAQMVSYPPELFEQELRNCEAVCMNCHAYRELGRDDVLLNRKWRPYARPGFGALQQDV